MATLTINYIANYPGNHRICYRQVGTTNYCCLTDVVAATGPQTFTIDFSVPADYCFGTANEVVTPVETACGPYAYEGYIQPICEPESSLLSRTPFGPITFTQDPSCLSYEVECITTDVASISLGFAGEAYLSIPTISFTGGVCGVSPAATVATMQAFNVQLSNPNNSLNYTPLDALTIVGGTGTAIQITVNTVDPITGKILTFTVTDNGSYSVLPGTTGVAASGGTGTGATFEINYEVEAITVGTLGTACTGPVFGAFSGGTPEVPATIEVVMDPCSSFTTPSCGATQVVSGEIAVPVIFCESTGLPIIPADYTVTPVDTCCNCSRVTAVVTGDLGTVLPYYYYTDYLTKDVVYVSGPIALNPGGVNLGTFQIQAGSFATAPGFNANLTLTPADCI